MLTFVIRFDEVSVTWIGRHLVVVAVVLFAVAATGGVFAFARPAYREPTTSFDDVNMQQQRLYTVAQVEQAFAEHGLLINSVTRRGDARTGTTTLDRRHGRIAPNWMISLFGPDQTVHFSKNMQGAYVSRFGNLMVFYGGKNAALMAHIEAAVADLQR
jgi:hypothetical protein